jgi:tetratricopeptide (TPR) repeat protein
LSLVEVIEKLTLHCRGSSDRAPQPTPAPSRRVSVPLATVSTYADRPDLSRELKEKLDKPHGTGLAHAVAVVGLGGMGKTQLVLHYIETHEAEYDTVLWIDVRSVETTHSSYERCCRVLGLQVETASEDKSLQDTPHVQAVLTWLRAQSDDKKWLVVTDNADDLSWDVSSIVPKGKAGTVVITSQDAHAARRILGGHSPTVKIDAMTSEEAVSLVANHFDEEVCHGSESWNLVKETTSCLDRLALPMDLAGARISVDVENWGNLDAALRQYLSDYRRNQDKFLQDAEYATGGSYNKTVWTAWETSLSSLRKIEHDQPAIYPIKLLSFLTLFDRTNIQDELFRQASLGLGEACRELRTSVPLWLRKLLAKGDDGEWDNSLYRDTINMLLRYGLVKPISEPRRGVTMHGLVQRRARQELPHGYWPWHMMFLVASCICASGSLGGPDGLRFHRHLILHFPPNDQLLSIQPHSQWRTQLAQIWERISLVYWDEGRFNEAVQLQSESLKLWMRIRGENDSQTLSSMSMLASIYSTQGLWGIANGLQSRVIQQREIQLGANHPLTLESRHSRAMTMLKERRCDDAVAENLAVLDIRSEILGDHHSDTLASKKSFALAYSWQGKWSKAQELQIEILEANKKSPDRYEPDLITSMDLLAITYSMQCKYREAEQLHIEALERLEHLYGRDHEDTLRLMRGLGITYSLQGRHREAEELRVETLERSSRVLGPEHLKTLYAMLDVFKTLRDQERWRAAEELAVKTLEVSSRVLGQNHLSTLDAMENLALAASGLGQNERAIDLMRRTAAVSSNVLGHDHPDCKRRHKKAAKWSAIQNNNDKAIGRDSNRDSNSV